LINLLAARSPDPESHQGILVRVGAFVEVFDQPAFHDKPMTSMKCGTAKEIVQGNATNPGSHASEGLAIAETTPLISARLRISGLPKSRSRGFSRALVA